MPRRKKFALLFVPALLVTGCGGDGDKGEAATTTVPPSSTAPGSTDPTPTNPVSSDPAKAEQAKAAIFQSSDLPAGWKEHDPEAGLNLETTWNDLTRCLGVDRKGQPLGIATSPTYLRGLATQARSTVEYLPAASTQPIAAALAGPRFKDCATKAFNADVKRSAPEGGVPGQVEVSSLDFPQLGQATSASRINVTINLDELEVPIFQDLIVVFDGDAVIRMMFLNPGGPFPPDLQRSLVDKAVGRA